MSEPTIVSDYRGGGGGLVEHRLVQWIGEDGKPRSAYVHPDKVIGDDRWWEGKKQEPKP